MKMVFDENGLMKMFLMKLTTFILILMYPYLTECDAVSKRVKFNNRKLGHDCLEGSPDGLLHVSLNTCQNVVLCL